MTTPPLPHPAAADDDAARAPVVSIGLPVFNGEAFLDRAIRDVLEQDHPAIELVISDNGSTDGTEAICRRWAASDPRVRYHRSADNHGAAWNFNRCFELATGPYFKWAAADDEMEPGFVSACLAILEADPDVALAYPQVVDIDADSTRIHEWGPLPRATSDDAGERVADVILNETRAFPVFGVARRSQLERTRLIKPWTGSDYLLLCDLAVQGRFVEVPAALFLHREHDGRSTRAYQNLRERTAWFDTRRSGRFSLPRWSITVGYALTPLRRRSSPAVVWRVLRATVVHARRQWKMLVKELLWFGGDGVQVVRDRLGRR